MIFVIDDNRVMAECIKRATRRECQIFSNAIEAMNAIDEQKPQLIYLDILLDGPDGFTFLNELASYSDTAQIPIVIVSSLNLNQLDLEDYGVVGILNKDTMLPQEIQQYADQYC